MNAKERRWLISLSCFVLDADTWTNDKAVANAERLGLYVLHKREALRTGGMERSEVMVQL